MTFLGGNTIITRKPACLPYKLLPGFNEYDDECFYIGEYELNVGSWLEGFIQVD